MRFIGSKINLLTEIDNIILENINDNSKTFLDLFAGTNSVGCYFKNRYKIISNDLLYFSYANAKAVIENNAELKFERLKEIGINSVLEFLSEEAEKYIVSKKVGYYEKSYTPTGEAMYFSIENGKRIDYIRNQIEEWYKSNLIQESEYYYLISVLIEAIPFISNITGTYGAFLKHWDKRALNQLELKHIEVLNNNRKNIALNMDANILVKNISADIAYIDTPYNNRQYTSNYHVLENIAMNKKPKLSGKTKLFYWQETKSKYAMKNKAYDTMKDLIENIDATHLIVSYNTEGIIKENELIELLKDNSVDNKVIIKRIPYRKYISKIASKENDLYEILLYIRKKKSTFDDIIVDNKEDKHITVWKGEKKEYIKSPLNYIGGKYKLLKQIIPLFPPNIGTFVDLFSGGANVGINVKAKHYIFNDMNYKINEMFRFFSKENPDDLILRIKSRIEEFNLSKENEEGYLLFRQKYNSDPNPLDLYVLTSFSYNYQFRFNNSMEFNNPFGRNRSSFSRNMENNLRVFLNRLNKIDAIFTDKYFSEFDIKNLNNNDFVYLDPPYLITTGNYNDGNRGFQNWGEIQENELYELMKKLTLSGIRYAFSNVLTHKGKTNDLLLEFIKSNNVRVYHLKHSYKNSSYNTKDLASEEVLITNYDPETYVVLK